jgi:hypothetical protein
MTSQESVAHRLRGALTRVNSYANRVGAIDQNQGAARRTRRKIAKPGITVKPTLEDVI